jgi:ribonuclease BN (tRNA processing enzyme)
MIDLKFLGNGSAFNTTKTNTSAYFTIDNTLYLIDCGCNVFDKIVNENILSGIKYVNIFITHTHPDHVGSLGNLLFLCSKVEGIIPVIYTHKEIIMYVNRFLTSQGLIPDTNYLLHDCSIIHNDFKYKHNNLSITISASLTHHTNEIPSCLFLIYIKDELNPGNNTTYLYTGDLSDQYINLINRNINTINKIYVECAKSDYNHIHVSIKALKEKIPQEYRDKIYCMHIEDDGEYITKEGFNVVTTI